MPIEHELFDKFLMHDPEASRFLLRSSTDDKHHHLFLLSAELRPSRIFEDVARTASSLVGTLRCVQRRHTSNSSHCDSLLHVNRSAFLATHIVPSRSIQGIAFGTGDQRALVEILDTDRKSQSERARDASRTTLENFQSFRNFGNRSRQRRGRTRTASMQRLSGLSIFLSRLLVRTQWSHVGVRSTSFGVSHASLSSPLERSKWKKTTVVISKCASLRSTWNVKPIQLIPNPRSSES